MLIKMAHIGRQAALAAGEVLRHDYLKPHRITLKGAIDPVTETDFKSQETIINLIHQNFPDHAILAEEVLGGGAGASGPWPSPQISPYRWIIDPLDGTVNFAHGFPMFCVSIAFEAEGIVEYGVVYDPLREELFEARRGGGATLNGEPIRVSAVDRLDAALLATGFPYDIRERLPETLGRLGRIMGVAQGVRRAGSAALDLCYVACGRLDGFWEEHLKPWDTAAGALIVTEASGRISTFSGDPYELTSPNVVASNGLLHANILENLNSSEQL
jgi:myo-inositol-1(or 4)-monophosphatase